MRLYGSVAFWSRLIKPRAIVMKVTEFDRVRL